MNFRENINLLSVISNEYACNRMAPEDYRQQRTGLLNLIDEELNGVKVHESNTQVEESGENTLLDKALSFLKLDKVKETN